MSRRSRAAVALLVAALLAEDGETAEVEVDLGASR